MTHWVPCDVCFGEKGGCYRCNYTRLIGVPDVKPNPAKNLRLLTRVFVFLIWLAAVFIVSYELFGMIARHK